MKQFLTALALILGALSNPAMAGDKDPLFVGLSSDAAQRVGHVLHFSELQLTRGHPLTIWLNERGVFLASRKHAKEHAGAQKALGELLGKGAVVLVCRYCMDQLGVKEADLLPGFKVGNPELVGGALFKDNTRTLSW